MCDAIIDSPDELTVNYTCHKGVCNAFDEQIVHCLCLINLKLTNLEYDHLTGCRKLYFKKAGKSWNHN